MAFKKIFFFFITSLAVVCCKKENTLTPINTASNVESIGCATCPSTFYQTESIAVNELSTCDDLTDNTTWPSGAFGEGETIGYTQEGTQAVIVGDGAVFASLNEFDAGIYGVGPILFNFDGGNQVVRFNIYGFYGQYNQMGFSVNGNEMSYMDDIFPLEIDGGVTVELDTSAENITGWTNAYLTITGNINQIVIETFESGITEVCVTKTISDTPPIEDTTADVYFTDFINYNGTVTGSYPNEKTPLGYYGIQGASMLIKFDRFLGYSPTKIGFVHARINSSENDLLNIQLPKTGLIVTTLDSLSYYLSPFGYNVTVIQETNGLLWQDELTPPINNATVDSVLITGKNINQLLIGADLKKGELRSICSYYE